MFSKKVVKEMKTQDLIIHIINNSALIHRHKYQQKEMMYILNELKARGIIEETEKCFNCYMSG